jgi:hypothetical protein
MLRFKVFENGVPAKSVNLESVYLVGNDRVPMRAGVEFSDGEIRCDTRAGGACALAVMWPVEGVGRVMLETTRLLARQRPYNLNVELARGQLMRINQKREDWGLYDYPDGRPIYEEIDAARDLLVEAITAPDDVTAARRGDAAIAASVTVGEEMSHFHAGIFFERRRAANQLVRRPLGCRLDHGRDADAAIRAMVDAFDFVSVPFEWRVLESREGKPEPGVHDRWLRRLRELHLPVRGCSLLSFEAGQVPDWLGVVSKDYDHLREAVAEHLRYVLKYFGGRVRGWEVISGLHACNAFRLSFEQIMELTRMSAILAKQMAPRSTAIIGIVLPWGEYYARDARTIPPFLYGEMVVQSGINFDAFGLEMRFGGGEPPHYVRDMLQVSAMLDRFGSLGKPVHVTAAGVPTGGNSSTTGSWHGDWSDEVQARWVHDFYQVALSKPFVETVTWQALVDPQDGSHTGGLLRADLGRKPAYDQILALRRKLHAEPPKDEAADGAR